MIHLSYLLLGLAAGLLSGFLGLGGGIVMIPALVYIYGLSQHQAQGTSLAVMVPPVTLLAALRYYHKGAVKTDMAVFIALGFILGGVFGADFAQNVSNMALKRVFGFVMLGAGLKMVLYP